jgi:hypothetical protein
MTAKPDGYVRDQISTHELEGTAWRVGLNIGREANSVMPSDWAASGARLAFHVDLQFAAAAASDASESLIGASNMQRAVHIIKDSARFVDRQGEQIVQTGNGAWCATPTGRGGEVALRFWLEFPDGAVRNDVNLPAGRVFFTTGCWDAKLLRLVESAHAQLTDELQALDASPGPAPGGNPLEAIQAGTRRAEERELLMSKLSAVRSSLPGPSGVLDGDVGSLKVGRRGGLSVKRRGGLLDMDEIYPVIGTFTLSRF